MTIGEWLFKSNERSENSYIVLADFFKSFFQANLNALITTDMHSYLLIHLEMFLGIYAFLEFN